MKKIWNFFRFKVQDQYRSIIGSIAFIPAFIAVVFLGIAVVILLFDFSEAGKTFKASLSWLSLKDASTARSIISSIAAGVISLTVFSFSMVMIVLNQAASNLSNRVLDKLIGNRFQQLVLGVYIGTIVYAFFLLSTIRDIDSGLYIPAISVYILILLTIFDIFLFIYFLHYITQSVKYEVIIERIYDNTLMAMKKTCRLTKHHQSHTSLSDAYLLVAPHSGVYEGFNHKELMDLCEKEDCVVEVLMIPGNYILKGQPAANVNKALSEEDKETVLQSLHLRLAESISGNFFYGFKQLMEIAVKALSPGINDPGTAIVSLRSLFRLYAFRAMYFPDIEVYDQQDVLRITLTPLTFEHIFMKTFSPIWDYGKEDRLVQEECSSLLSQLSEMDDHAVIGRALREVKIQQNQKTTF